MLGFVIFFGGISIWLTISLIRGAIIDKREHPYPYCRYYPRPTRTIHYPDMFNNNDVIYMRTGFPEECGIINSPDSIMDVTKF